MYSLEILDNDYNLLPNQNLKTSSNCTLSPLTHTHQNGLLKLRNDLSTKREAGVVGGGNHPSMKPTQYSQGVVWSLNMNHTPLSFSVNYFTGLLLLILKHILLSFLKEQWGTKCDKQLIQCDLQRKTMNKWKCECWRRQLIQGIHSNIRQMMFNKDKPALIIWNLFLHYLGCQANGVKKPLQNNFFPLSV